MPLDSNFGFYSTHDFDSNNFYDISECLLSSDKSFSLINNCNIRNLSANFDKLSNNYVIRAKFSFFSNWSN